MARFPSLTEGTVGTLNPTGVNLPWGEVMRFDWPDGTHIMVVPEEDNTGWYTARAMASVLQQHAAVDEMDESGGGGYQRSSRVGTLRGIRNLYLSGRDVQTVLRANLHDGILTIIDGRHRVQATPPESKLALRISTIGDHEKLRAEFVDDNTERPMPRNQLRANLFRLGRLPISSSRALQTIFTLNETEGSPLYQRVAVRANPDKHRPFGLYALESQLRLAFEPAAGGVLSDATDEVAVTTIRSYLEAAGALWPNDLMNTQRLQAVLGSFNRVAQEAKGNTVQAFVGVLERADANASFAWNQMVGIAGPGGVDIMKAGLLTAVGLAVSDAERSKADVIGVKSPTKSRRAN